MRHHAPRPRAAGHALATLVLCLGVAGSAEAQQPRTVLVGVFVESNYSTQPGVQVSYSSERLLGGGPRFSAAYSTTRLATALGSNALVEDRFQAGAGWHFRRDRTVSPNLTASAGYARFGVDDDPVFALLDSGSPFVSLLIGTEVRLLPALRVGGNVGYSPLQSSTVYPLVATLGLNYAIRAGGRR
jgi:hypothetical protein